MTQEIFEQIDLSRAAGQLEKLTLVVITAALILVRARAQETIRVTYRDTKGAILETLSFKREQLQFLKSATDPLKNPKWETVKTMRVEIVR